MKRVNQCLSAFKVKDLERNFRFWKWKSIFDVDYMHKWFVHHLFHFAIIILNLKTDQEPLVGIFLVGWLSLGRVWRNTYWIKLTFVKLRALRDSTRELQHRSLEQDLMNMVQNWSSEYRKQGYFSIMPPRIWLSI